MGVSSEMRKERMRERLVQKGAVQMEVAALHRQVRQSDVLYFGIRFLRGLIDACPPGMLEFLRCGAPRPVPRPVVVNAQHTNVRECAYADVG